MHFVLNNGGRCNKYNNYRGFGERLTPIYFTDPISLWRVSNKTNNIGQLKVTTTEVYGRLQVLKSLYFHVGVLDYMLITVRARHRRLYVKCCRVVEKCV